VAEAANKRTKTIRTNPEQAFFDIFMML